MKIRSLNYNDPADAAIINNWTVNSETTRYFLGEWPNLAYPYETVLISLDDCKPVGWIDFFNIDTTNKKCEVGMVMPELAGRRVAVRAVYKLMEYPFVHLELNRVVTRIIVTNRASQKFVKALGFNFEGIEKESCCKDGAFHDVAVFSLLKSQYERVKNIGYSR
jgi:RimJ/RimL family protein N-acetyltransferase